MAAGSQERQMLKMQLLSYIAWQWDRYLVPQNILLVKKKYYRSKYKYG